MRQREWRNLFSIVPFLCFSILHFAFSISQVCNFSQLGERTGGLIILWVANVRRKRVWNIKFKNEANPDWRLVSTGGGLLLTLGPSSMTPSRSFSFSEKNSATSLHLDIFMSNASSSFFFFFFFFFFKKKGLAGLAFILLSVFSFNRLARKGNGKERKKEEKKERFTLM